MIGLETEYAVRYSGRGPHPGNDVIYQHLMEAVSRFVESRPGSSAPGRDQLFLENGGAFYYEFLPHCRAGGLVEGATPECRGPGQLLVCQRAQEALLLEALPIAESRLRLLGFEGELGLLKNCRDAEGHVYGAQENFEANMASGFGLGLYRLGLVLLLPLVLVQSLLSYLLAAVLVVSILAVLTVGFFVSLLVPPWLRFFLRLVSEDNRDLENSLGRVQLWLAYVLIWPLSMPLSWVLRATAFRAIRRHALAFLISRPVISGCGSVDADGHFDLSEKGPSVRRLMRFSISPDERPIFDTGNLVKMLGAPMNLQLAPLLRLFRRRQRVQLGLADSNRAQVAEYLKIGTTDLVLDMIESGFLDDAPMPRRPIEALRALVADPTLEQRVEMRDGPPLSGLEIQRFYLERSRAFLRRAATASLEERQTVDLWEEVLSALEERRWGSLVGKLDWVTKRFLLEECGDSDPALLKTLDLRYHELGDGYFARLEDAGQAPILVADDEVRHAMHEPPANTPAFHRGRLIRRQIGSSVPLRVTWDSAYVGRRLRAKVIPFHRRS